jgi:hypothetical protein
MRLKRIYIAIVLLAVPLLAFLVAKQHKVPSPGVTLANFNQLHKGMSEKEVEAIMGKPGNSVVHFSPSHMTKWSDSPYSLSIIFNDNNGRAVYGALYIAGKMEDNLREEPPPSFFKRMANFFKNIW